MKRLLSAFALALCVCGVAGARELPRDSVYQLPVQLTDQDGRARAWSASRGQPQLAGMFYASCQYICPLIIESGKAIERQLTEAERARLRVVLISMDPERDDPAALRVVADQRRIDTTRWTLGTPPASEVRAVAGLLGIRYRRLADGEFNHTSALVLLDAEGRVLARTEKMGSRPDPAFVEQVRQALAAP